MTLVELMAWKLPVKTTSGQISHFLLLVISSAWPASLMEDWKTDMPSGTHTQTRICLGILFKMRVKLHIIPPRQLMHLNNLFVSDHNSVPYIHQSPKPKIVTHKDLLNSEFHSRGREHSKGRYTRKIVLISSYSAHSLKVIKVS